MDNVEKLNEIKEKAEEFYKSIGEIYNPYLKRKISFNAKGLGHIKFKEWQKARLASEQYLRLKFLKVAPEIVSVSHTLQEYKETKCFERQKINSRWEFRMVDVKYYGFVAIIKKLRVKIIIKEIIGGNPYFWSVIPFWKTKNNPIIGEIKKIFHEGDLETQ
jgi:hypothetical protein